MSTNPFLLMKPLLFLLLTLTAQAAAPQVPATSTHCVIQGETLFSIARQHHCTVAALKKVNGLTSDLIQVKQILKLPAGAAVPKPAPVPVPPAAPEPAPEVKAPATLADALKRLPAVDRMKVHLFLDQALFAPGKVDGLLGEFTVKAAERWIAAGEGRDLNALLLAAREKIVKTQTNFTIPASAANWVGPMPATLEEKAAATTLLYESLAEYAAERFHTDLSTLRRLNPGMNLAALKMGDTIQVPAVAPFIIESWPTPGVLVKKTTPNVRLHIAYDERMIEVLRPDGTLSAAFPITVGTKPGHRRTGAWQIRSLTANPKFLWDDTMLKEGRKGDKQHLLPKGPNNPVGILWMEIEPLDGPEAHIGIHGTADPARIGRNHSSGCIRLANWDIVRLAKLVGKGTIIAWSEPPAGTSTTLAVAESR